MEILGPITRWGVHSSYSTYSENVQIGGGGVGGGGLFLLRGGWGEVVNPPTAYYCKRVPDRLRTTSFCGTVRRYSCNQCCGFGWIRIHMWIQMNPDPCVDPNPAFQVNPDLDTDPDLVPNPGPGFLWPKIEEEKKIQLSFFFFLLLDPDPTRIWIHNTGCNQPSKHSALKNIKFLPTFLSFFSIFVGHFCPPGSESQSVLPIRIWIQPTKIHCGSGSESLLQCT